MTTGITNYTSGLVLNTLKSVKIIWYKQHVEVPPSKFDYPFSHTLLLIVAKMDLPKRSAQYWSNPPFLIF